ncbi:aldehyde dehydrogenase family protein [archaeon]|nr:MAG: aldehyde dehydrogenase family protein [archaeon]
MLRHIQRSALTVAASHRVRAVRALSKLSVPDVLAKLNIQNTQKGVYCGEWITAKNAQINHQINPANGEKLGEVEFGTEDEYHHVISAMDAVKDKWANTPAPVRGEIVRKLGDRLRHHKAELGAMVSLEMGKILTEGLGEVQEAIDICDYAVGLSRCLNGSVIPSERPGHFMMERYNPLKGHVAIITAFNFPVAVYFWNLALSLVAGNTNLWKPHETTSLVSVAVTKIVDEVLRESNQPGAIASMICGTGQGVGERMVRDPRVELVSFTGSTHVGRHVGKVVAGRFGKSILELGGNNAMIVDKSADLDMALRATLFGAVGTAGQRCTTQRRLYLHKDIYDTFLTKLLPAYKTVKIGSPMDSKTLCGPLHSQTAVQLFNKTITEAKAQNGKLLVGGNVLSDRPGNFVEPAVVAIEPTSSVLQDERFVPILYVMKVDSVDQAISYNNCVKQGLSSSLFTQDLGQIFKWTGPSGSDCGIVNVNIGTSGAEIGGAFGGEKETGGGRESGSDSWKQYMRRSTCTINYSKELPLAQGVNFGP